MTKRSYQVYPLGNQLQVPMCLAAQQEGHLTDVRLYQHDQDGKKSQH